jgi:hypothetical protein
LGQPTYLACLDSPLRLVQTRFGGTKPVRPVSLSRSLLSLSRKPSSLAICMATVSPPWPLPRSGQVRLPLTSPPTPPEPPCDDLSICPRGSVDSFLLLEIASRPDLETNRLRRLVVSGELWSSPSTLACSWNRPGAGAVLSAPVPSSPGCYAVRGVRRRNAGVLPGFAAITAARALPRHVIASAFRRG